MVVIYIIHDFLCDLLAFFRNLKLFLKLAWEWRPWDSHYTIHVFTQLLKENGRCCRDGDKLNGVKMYRRAMTAAGMLEKAYTREIDKTILYLHDRNPVLWTKTDRGFYRMDREEVTEPRIYDGMYEVARKRSEKAEEQAKKEAWAYLHKYIEHFWD